MKNEAQINQFEKTVKNLEEVVTSLDPKRSDYAIFRDSAIQRFEIAFDICWKTLKERLRQDYGIDVSSPKKVFQESFKQGLIENDEIWIKMTDIRNETSHVYSEEFAEKIATELPKILITLKDLLWKLKK